MNVDMTVGSLKLKLDEFMAGQRAEFITDTQHIDALLRARSDFIDGLLIKLWQHFDLPQPNLSLFAVGGFGRQELHPLSDIDLLILSRSPLSFDIEQKISTFITLLWDLRLVVGHSVRTLDECIEIGQQDLSVATSLQEARFIIGDEALKLSLVTAVFAKSFWSTSDFFHAKVKEQQLRHQKYNNTANNLEPDIKSCPGGLRDINTLSWIARRHFGATSLKEMSKYGFLTAAEFAELQGCQQYLWKIRFALHSLLKRADDRLTFTYQHEVAKLLGFKGTHNQAIELMMKGFYRTLGRVTELNQMLIQLFAQEIEIEKLAQNQTNILLSDDFQRHGAQIEARKADLFTNRPDSILDMFLHIADNSHLESIAAPTLRQLRASIRVLIEPISSIALARKKFITLVSHPNAFKAIRLMHKHAVLAAYLPQWHNIVGQMQFDLFHAYTVDEHSVRLLNHIESFTDAKNKDKHPICCELFPRLAKPQLLIIAAIFHDIAKGRNGDHSKLGSVEAYQFCLQHGLAEIDTRLVSWLVEKHLLMSVTAQRRDIYDPDVIKEFAQEMQNEERINYLICLTVADICATNPTLWNSWKRTLLSELYHATLNVLRRGHSESFSHVKERIRHNKHLARDKLLSEGFDEATLRFIWKRFKAEYFLRHNAAQIAWHTKQISMHHSEQPLVVMTDQNSRGSTEIFIYAKDKSNLFAQVVNALDKKNLSVHDAQIMTSKDSFTLDTFIVLDAQQRTIPTDRYQSIIRGVINALTCEGERKMVKRIAPKKLMAFSINPQVQFLPTAANNKTMIELVALDVPGLLAKIGAAFAELNLSLQTAKITTTGETAEDFFIVSNANNLALNASEQQALRVSLLEILGH